MPINSRQKGARGERLWRDVVRAEGYEARRGQQFAGGPDSPDVISSLPFHMEVKCVEALNIWKAVEQAQHDAAGQPWLVAHKRNRSDWLVTISAETFFKLVRGDFSGPADETCPSGCECDICCDRIREMKGDNQ